MENSLFKSDEILVQEIIDGNLDAFTIIVNRHRHSVKGFIIKKFQKVGEEIFEDVLQDTFLKAMDALQGGRYQEEGKFHTWLIRIARNCCIDYLRKRKKESSLEEGQFAFLEIPDLSSGIEEKIIDEEEAQEILHLIELLPAEQREVVLYRLEQIKFKDIADIVDTSINTVLARRRYALSNLRKLLRNQKLRSSKKKEIMMYEEMPAL
jgi:RNA polymerase sigma-70 factor, ECF subfamily